LIRAALPALCLALSACPHARSPEARLEEALQDLAARGFSDGGVEVGPSAITWTALVGRAEGDAVKGTARVTIEGRASGVPFSYMGTERVQARCGVRCELDGAPARRMIGVLSALRARRAALAEGDEAALRALAADGVQLASVPLADRRDRAPAAWFVKVERGQALVGEAAADGKQHPLSLEERGSRWVFTAGLP
jgi:hypothetical protein